jgi:hypothetical protein
MVPLTALRCRLGRLKSLLTVHREDMFAKAIGETHRGEALTPLSGGEEGLHEGAIDVT